MAKFSSAKEISTLPRTYEVQEGSQVVLDCAIAKNPEEDKTLWTKVSGKNRELVYVGDFKMSKDPHFGRRFKNNSLEIVNANKDDEGDYVCQLTAGAGETVVHKLVIQYKPVMDENPETLTVLENTEAKLECKAEGVPAPRYTWERKVSLGSFFNQFYLVSI